MLRRKDRERPILLHHNNMYIAHAANKIKISSFVVNTHRTPKLHILSRSGRGVIGLRPRLINVKQARRLGQSVSAAFPHSGWSWCDAGAHTPPRHRAGEALIEFALPVRGWAGGPPSGPGRRAYIKSPPSSSWLVILAEAASQTRTQPLVRREHTNNSHV
ncbi:hypothetical protein EVAR_5980_1 [Eumeta japonica]|uniref:Uncharacterized protein n=1 Tax=Eumeta variegata TaxID=151549 RepID=A0A4C1T9M3_EUMVA|nr:hypothetical protein EVAR_5980_1 [Eumeta japonica]